jgi:hypothetical protein
LRYIESSTPSVLEWNAQNTPELATVAPGQSGEFTATLRIKKTIEPALLAGDVAPALQLAAEATYTLENDALRPVREDTPRIPLTIATRASIDAAALYYTTDGEQLGIGPLPPKVGVTTKYRVIVFIANTTSDITDAVFEAALPPSVAWTGKYSVNAGEAFDYLPLRGVIRWNIGRVQKHASSVGPRIGASFEVAVTPTSTELGNIMTILTNMHLSGKDEATGVKVYAAHPDITTDLTRDEHAKNKGTVVK